MQQVGLQKFIACLLFFYSLSGLGGGIEHSDDYDKAITFFVENHFTAGIATTVLEDGSFRDYFGGTKDLKTQEAVDENTYFALGSITKVFVTTILAREVVLGHLKLDDRVAEFFPELAKAPVGRATLEELATHTAGLSRLPQNFKAANDSDPFLDYTLEKLIEDLKEEKRGKKKYQYSSQGIALLTQILIRAKKMSFAEMVNREIMAPLKLEGMRVQWNEELPRLLSKNYDNALFEIPHWTQLNAMEGTAGIHANLKTMKRFLVAQMYPERVPSPLGEAIKLSHKIHFRGPEFNIGLGWFIDRIRGIPYINHNGSTVGFTSELYFDPRAKRGIVVLNNSDAIEPGVCLAELFTERRCEKPSVRKSSREHKFLGKFQMQGKDIEPPGIVEITKHKQYGFLFMNFDGEERFRLLYDGNGRFHTSENIFRLSFEENGDARLIETVESFMDGEASEKRTYVLKRIRP